MSERICLNCGSPFEARYSISQQQFCSRECVRDGRAQGLAPRRQWTDEEIGVLQDHEHLSARAVGEILGRGMQSVQHMRNKIRDGWAPEREPWSESEIDFVRSTPNLTAQQVAEKLGRSYYGVAMIRSRLRASEGLTFGVHGERKNPNHVGRRRLLAKTCLGCGLLLDASWFSQNHGGKGRVKSWRPRCNRCAFNAAKESGKYQSGHQKDSGKSAKASYEKLQAITRERATRHGQPWLDADHEVLRDPELTTFEKALKLGRTWAATHLAVSQNGYVSKVGKGDPMKGRWVIDNPNEAALAA